MSDRPEVSVRPNAKTLSWVKNNPWIVDACCALVGIVTLVIGSDFWKAWLSTSDRLICTAFAVLGLLASLARCNWGSECTLRRFRLFGVTFGLSILVALLSWSTRRADWSCVALSLLVASWFGLRARGERVSVALFMGALVAFPLAINAYQNGGHFDTWQSSTLNMTAGLAGVLGLPFAREGETILFAQGTAHAFEIVGVWDGVVSWLGVAIGCVFAMRRNLLSALCSLGIVPFLWMTIRSTAWVTLALMSHSSSTWHDWNSSIAVGTFLIGIALVLGLDILFSRFFQPIPFELFNAESPLVSYAWNWLCGLPGIRLRIPKTNKIYASWRAKLKSMKKEPSWRTDLIWFRVELYYLASNPLAILGGIIDAVRGWLYSRQWRWIWRTVSALALPCLLYILYAFSFLSKSDKQVQFIGDESQKLCSTSTLEIASNQIQEPAFSRAMGSEPREVAELPSVISKQTLKYAELLSKRILGIDPKNQMARYRLALIYAIGEQPDRASEEMNKLANGQFGVFPQANAWMAKDYVIRRKEGQDLPFEAIVQNVDKLIGVPQVDDRLLRDYSRLLELRGDNSKAVAVALLAEKINPELVFDLALLYNRIRHPELKEIAAKSEEYFRKKINIPFERESDRIAVAKSMMLAERWEQVESVLEEGLKNHPDHKLVRRELSDLQIRLYQRSMRENEQGKLAPDLSLLEKAVATDPENPNVATEVTKMIPLGIDPSNTLREALVRQMGEGITTVDAHLLLGDAYFNKGDIAKAKVQWKAAMDKDRNNVPAMNNYAYCLAVSQPPDFEQSIGLLNQALQLSPENAEVLDTLGEVLMLANRPREAVNKFELSIAYNKKSIATRKKLLGAYRASGLNSEVIRLQQIITELEAAESSQQNSEKKP